MERDPFDLVGGVLDGKFRIDALAGVGDFNVLYRGRSVHDDVPVAVQCLRWPASLDGTRIRALAEAFLAGSRLHERLAKGNANVVQSLATGSARAKTGTLFPFFVRRWLDGECLASDLARRRIEGQQGRSVKETVALLAPAFEAAVAAHAVQEAHLVFNPRNLFLTNHGDRRSLQVLDFGVARAINELRPPLAEYAAPEQLHRAFGPAGAWTDVYSLAIVTLEVLSDKVVVADRKAALDRAHRPTPSSLGLAVPRDLEVALSRAVSVAPQERPRTVVELWRVLQSAARPPAEVSGAVPGRQPRVVASPSLGTAPMGFPPPKRKALARREEPLEMEPDLPPVHALIDPLPPRVEPLALPPVIVAADTPLPSPVVHGTMALSPRPAPGPTFPRIESQRRSRAVIVVVAAIVGIAAGTGLVMLSLRLRAARGAREATEAPATPGPSSRAFVLPPSIADALGSAAPQARGLASASVPGPSSEIAASEPVADHFPAGIAKQALDALSVDVAKCRRGKVWGIAVATVHFGNDGSVSQVTIGVPLTGTPTGACVSDTLSTAHVNPFAGKVGVVPYRFYVSPK